MMDHYRIVMVAACPFPCERGTPVRIHRMAEALVQRGHEVHVVTYHLSEPVEVHDNLHIHRISDIPTYRKMDPGPTFQKLFVLDTLLIHKLRTLLKERPFDVIHAHHVEGFFTAFVARHFASRVPIVFDAHTLLESELPYYGYRSMRTPIRIAGGWLDRLTSRRADYLITVTEDIQKRLLALGATTPQSSTTIGNGVELERFQGLVRRRRRPNDDCIVVFAGNLAPYQGIAPLLQAFALLHRRRNNARLRIVTPTSFAPFESLANELKIRDAIELISDGFNAVPTWLAASDIAVNPRIEAPGLPQKTMNYMAAGMPIASFAGSGQHLVDEKTALLAVGRKPEALAAALERLMDNPELAECLGQAARTVVMEQMSWERTATLVEQVYARVTRHSRAG